MGPGDYELDRSGDVPPAPPPRRSRKYAGWAAVLVAVAIVLGGAWYVRSIRQPPPPAASVQPAAQPATAPERPTAPLVKAADIDLPPLPDTDPLVRELVARLSSHPTVAAWLATLGLVNNFTVVTLNISEGRAPSQFLRPIAPRGQFRTANSGEELVVETRSYERYNLIGDAVSALDAAGTASLYLTLKPRITDAYRELGHPEGDFDRVLERAIGVLLKTPPLDARASLYPKGITYAYSDPRLESLPAAQKQLLRLGPRNGEAVRRKLAEIAALLGLNP
jgi:hypothetical protein